MHALSGLSVGVASNRGLRFSVRGFGRALFCFKEMLENGKKSNRYIDCSMCSTVF